MDPVGVGRFTHRILPREWKDRLTRSTLMPSSYRMVLAEAPDRWARSRPPASMKVGCPTNRPNGEGELEGGSALLLIRGRLGSRMICKYRSAAVRRTRWTHERQSDGLGLGSSMSESAERGQGPQPIDSLGQPG